MPYLRPIFRAAVYIRVSTKPQDDPRKISLKVQEKDLLNLLKNKGWQFYKLYKDVLSGSLLYEDRIAGKELLVDAAAGKFNLVVVWDIDRIGRDVEGLVAKTFRHRLRELGVQIYSLNQPNDPKTPEEFEENPIDDGQMLLESIHDWQSGSTVNKFRKRSMMGKVERIKNGLMINTPPYGYKMEPQKDEHGNILVRKDGRIVYRRVKNEYESEIVKRIYYEYVQQGKSQNEIRDGLNADGIPTKKGKSWERAMVGRILKNPVYYGALYYNRYYRRKNISGKAKWGHNPKEKWIIVPPDKTEHPAIVSKDLFNEAQSIRMRKLKVGAVAVYSDFLLSGLVKCGVCGSVMHRKKVTSQYKRKSDGGVSKSQCNGYVCGRWERFKDTERNYISEKDLKGAILGDLQKYKNNPNVLKGFLEENERKDLESTSNRLRIVRNNLTKVNDRYDRLLKAYELGRLPLEKFDEAVNNLNNEERQMKELIIELEEKILAESQREMGKKEFEKAINNFESLFQLTDIKEQKRFLREMIDHVVAGEDNIKINYLIASA